MAEAGIVYSSVPFEEQIEFFKRKHRVLTESYLDVWESEHDTAFMVAGANRDDLLADFEQAILRAIDGDATLRDFRRDFDRITATYGWDYAGGRNWRSRVIYETNLRQSYNAGRWAQLQAVKKARPYWRYRHNDSVVHPRPLHQAWDGMILHADDPWWLIFFPSNGWGCQCYVEALSERDLRRLGKSGPDTAPPIQWQEVIVGQRSLGGPRTVLTPVGVDPGFAYAPGATTTQTPRGSPRTPPALRRQIERTAQTALEKTTRLPALPAAESAAPLLRMPRVTSSIEAGFSEWASSVVARGQPGNHSYLVGALEPRIVRSLTAHSIEPVTAAIVMRDTELLHALRDSKRAILDHRGQPIALTLEEISRLPSLLTTPSAVLLDPDDSALLYIADASTRREAAKFVVYVNYKLKTQAGREIVNSVRTATLLDLRGLVSNLRGGLLRLLQGALE